MVIREAKRGLKGIIRIPGDKSVSHRAVMLGSIAEGITAIDGFLMGQDCISTINCFRKMGVKIDVDKTRNRVIVYGKGLYVLKPPKQLLDVGNSGTTIRLLLGILAGQPFTAEITGDDSIKRRPMARVTKPLRLMGAEIYGRDDANLAPLKIKGGRLKGIDYKSPVASAQVKSCLLLAGLYAEGETKVTEPAKSRDHTERMLKHFGCPVTVEGNTVKVRRVDSLTAADIVVPGDFSSAAFFIVAATLIPDSHITIEEVGINPTRTGLLDVLNRMGAEIRLRNKRVKNNEPVADIEVVSSKLKSTEISGEIIPRLIDEIPILSVAAAFAEGTTVIKDATELKVKESNRLSAMAAELNKMGVEITETDDGLIIKGSKQLHSAEVESHNDHRIAMAMSVAGLKARGETVIKGSDCVSVSFPGYFSILQKHIY